MGNSKTDRPWLIGFVGGATHSPASDVDQPGMGVVGFQLTTNRTMRFSFPSTSNADDGTRDQRVRSLGILNWDEKMRTVYAPATLVGLAVPTKIRPHTDNLTHTRRRSSRFRSPPSVYPPATPRSASREAPYHPCRRESQYLHQDIQSYPPGK